MEKHKHTKETLKMKKIINNVDPTITDESALQIANNLVTIQEIKEEHKLRHYIINKEKNEFNDFIKANYGGFYFTNYNKVLNSLSNQVLVRYIYLCTYIDYDNNLVHDNVKPHKNIYEKDLETILKLQYRETLKTKKELVQNKLIVINKDKTITINKQYCTKGKISTFNKEEKIRIFRNGIRDIYENATPKQHKQIAIIFKLLPYVNYQYNIVCANPYENDLNAIKPYDIKDICNIVEYVNTTLFKKALSKLYVGDTPAVLLTTALDVTTIFINPRVYYKGNDMTCIRWVEDIINISKNKVDNN